jgi:hypothetical protein
MAGEIETGGWGDLAGGALCGAAAVCEYAAQPETTTPTANIADSSNNDRLISS